MFPEVNDALKAREAFPCGLIQPEGSYRFGLEALLLAAYALKQAGKASTVAEPGCGCGAALLALALSGNFVSCAGFDIDGDLVNAATRNAHLLGLKDTTTFFKANVRDLPSSYCGNFDLVIANPPWWKGRLPDKPLRQRALIREPDTIHAFSKCASQLLHERGRFCIIIPPGIFCELVECLQPLHLGLRRITAVSSFARMPAKRLLCMLQKGAASDPEFSSPLVLRLRTDTGSEWTEETKIFCPWIN